mgnify:CR=1 FL=1
MCFRGCRTSVVVGFELFFQIYNADQILVLSDGVLQGCGKHDELLQTVPLYKIMWEKENSVKNWKLA